ncbi:MAG: malonyl CoA-acyl carrier protein transacylase [Gemmatimonadales bacterium]|nr:MAG: malonyl CoA-acyl carrier protein transacylase [Gemmatimonadales bacterium]
MVRAVLLCPGQGAQRVGMGKDLAERFPVAREVFAAADEELGFALSRLMWEGDEAELTLTHNAQPAILVHSMAVLETIGGALAPAAAAGHSLGEYSAYAAARSLSLGDAIRLVRRRGELMLAAGKGRPGTMAVVLGLECSLVEEACRQASGDHGVAVAANLNSPEQVVISGDPAAVEAAGARCKELGAKRVAPLKVSGAFHSPLMEPARLELEAELQRVELKDPQFPVIANVTGEPVREAGTARRLLALQLTAPVRWIDCMRTAAREAGPEAVFVEIGPGNVLAGLLKRIVPEAKVVSVGTAAEVERFLEAA